MAKLSLASLSSSDLSGKRVFVRVDFNVPLDHAGIITDDTRAEFPISKNHLAEIDFNRTMKFQKFEGNRA